MKDEQYKKAAEIFDAAADLKGDARREYLDHACHHDPELREYMELLLAEDAAEEDAFEESRLRMGQELLAEALGVSTRPTEDESHPATILPETIGRYRILEKLGEGGMGSVYLAEQDHPHRRVALKMIRPDLFSKGLQKRFQFEAEVLGRLQHPGIAQIHEAGELETEHGPQPYFAMEYIDGIELRRYGKEHELKTRARLELVARVADAVHHAHQKGIVHRDLKPENVLVTEMISATAAGVETEFADLGQPKILDFGVARATDADLQLTTLQTEPGQIVGTLPYMSPEQVAGDSRRLDVRSDIYALGVLMYELLAGRPPFDLRHKPIPEAARIIREDEPTRLGSVDTAYRGDIDTIACKALEKDRDRRYSSAVELSADIRRYLANEPITAHPPSTFYQLRKFAQRHKGFVAGLALTLLVLIVGIISSVTLTIRALQGEKLAKKNEERALSSEAAAERNAYRLSLAAAQAVGESDANRALTHLDAVPPEFRKWEWHYLNASFNSHIAEYRGSALSGSSSNVARGSGGDLRAALPRGEAIELVNLESGEIHSVFEKGRGLRDPCLSPEGSHLSAISKDGKKAYIWKTEAREFLNEIPLEDGIYGSFFSPHGKWLVICFLKKPWILIETESGRLETLPMTPSGEWGGAFTSDESCLLTRVGFGKVPQYSTENKNFSASDYKTDILKCFAFSPDNQRIAVGQGHGKLRFLDANTLDEIDSLHGHTGNVVALAFSMDGRYLASASEDNTIRVWDVAKGATLRVFPWIPQMGYAATSLAFSEDGTLLAAGNAAAARLWIWRGDTPSVLEGHDDYVYHVVYHPHGFLLASSSFWGDVRLWDALRSEPLAVLPGGQPRYCLGFTPDGTRLAASRNVTRDHSGKLTFDFSVWDPHAACRLNEPRIPADAVFFKTADPMAIDPEIRFFRAVSGGSKVSLKGGESMVSSPDQSFMVQPFEDDCTLYLWDLETVEPIRKIGKHEYAIYAAAFSPDGTGMVSGDAGGVIKVWDFAGVGEAVILEGHSGKVYTLSYSPDGTRIVSGDSDGAIFLWNAQTFEQVLSLRGHTNYVHSVAFSSDGTQLASGSGDGTVRIWDSVPPGERWKQVRAARALQREASPLVDRLLKELGDPKDVADRLRGDVSLNEDLRRAALMVLLRRSMSKE